MKRKFIDTEWECYTYDVWGNEKDGYEVNDRYSHGTVKLRLPIETANPNTPQAFDHASPSDKQIRDCLDIKPRIHIDVDGDDLTIYARHVSTGYPFGEMHCVSHDSLSPIREKQKSNPNTI